LALDFAPSISRKWLVVSKKAVTWSFLTRTNSDPEKPCGSERLAHRRRQMRH